MTSQSPSPYTPPSDTLENAQPCPMPDREPACRVRRQRPIRAEGSPSRWPCGRAGREVSGASSLPLAAGVVPPGEEESVMATICRSRVRGCMCGHEVGFRGELVRLGYAPTSVEYQVWLMSRLSQWLDTQGLDAAALDEAMIEHFMAAFRATGLAASRRRRSATAGPTGGRAGRSGRALSQLDGPRSGPGVTHDHPLRDHRPSLLDVAFTCIAGRRRRAVDRGGRDRIPAPRTQPQIGHGFAQGSCRRASVAAALLACRGVHPVVVGRCGAARRRLARHRTSGDDARQRRHHAAGRLRPDDSIRSS